MLGHRDSVALEMRARHQRAGYLWKLPMSKSTSEKWQRRLFIAKDGFLLYYAGNTPAETSHFDTKPKGVIPLGGCKVDLVDRGPKMFKYGLRITHPDFIAGRMLILAAETADEQKAWLEALTDCSRVTMENAKLGDAMVEKFRAQGTAAEKEKADALDKLQAQALALKAETEERLKLALEGESLKATMVEVTERARKKEEAAAAMIAELERRKAELDANFAEMKSAIEERAAAIAASNAEYAKVQAALSEKSGDADLEARARALENEKQQLEHEKMMLQRNVRELTTSTEMLKSNLDSAEAQRQRLETQLRNLSSEEGDLAQERQMRKRLERKLQIAEDSLKRLDSALRRSGVKLDVDVFADVKTLLAFFEERVEEVRRDAQRIDIMKKALQAKRRYLVATARADNAESVALAELEAAAAEEDAWDEDKPTAREVAATKTFAAARASTVATTSTTAGTTSTARQTAVATTAAPAPAAVTAASSDTEDRWGDDDSAAPGPSDDEASGISGAAGVAAGAKTDQYGALPDGWTVQVDDEGDVWYYNEKTQQTSWYRPNEDGSIPDA